MPTQLAKKETAAIVGWFLCHYEDMSGRSADAIAHAVSDGTGLNVEPRRASACLAQARKRLGLPPLKASKKKGAGTVAAPEAETLPTAPDTPPAAEETLVRELAPGVYAPTFDPREPDPATAPSDPEGGQYVTMKGGVRVPLDPPPPPVSERPTCPGCGARLYPEVKSRWASDTSGDVVARYWTGKWDSYDHFCSLRCAWGYAERMFEKHGDRFDVE